DRPRLGALRAVASAGWRVGGATDPTRRVGPVRHDADAAVSRRDLRRALVARAQARTWWWHAGGRAPARRRVLCCRTRGPGSDRHPLAPAGRRSPGPVDLHRRLEPPVPPPGAARRGTEPEPA